MKRAPILQKNNTPAALQVVWFKKDLRVDDHAALAAAAEHGPVLPIYIVEPDLWRQPDLSGRHWEFASECLHELRLHLARLGQPLILRVGAAVDVLQQLQVTVGAFTLWSHEETGNAWTFARDQRVDAWCRSQGVAWRQVRQTGVIRRLSSRDGWAGKWDQFMSLSIVPPPPALMPIAGVAIGHIPSAADLSLYPDTCPERQAGGRSAAFDALHSFLTHRGQFYRKEMSSPVTAITACSRLSPYLTWGSVSMREAAQAAWQRQSDLRTISRSSASAWGGSLNSFLGRLHWHCHFMQKLEDEPRIEFENMHRAYDGLRDPTCDKDRLAAWAAGETGLPFVDACMRALHATGWMNFRMRAMLMAVASYHLWLEWRKPGEQLARLFTDYEPGIHWPQVQMQSGTTGINTVRIYNPVKQGHDHDPDGDFVRRWVPELAPVSTRFIHQPWGWPQAGSVLGKTYPFPIVDHLAAAKAARQKVWSLRTTAEYREQAGVIQNRHGSRKKSVGRPSRKPAKNKPSRQLSLELAPGQRHEDT